MSEPMDTPRLNPGRQIDLTVGGFMSTAFGLWAKLWPMALVLSLCVGIPIAAVNLIGDPTTRGILLVLVSSIVGIFGNQLIVAMLTYSALMTLNGQPSNLATARDVALKRLMPVLGTSLLYGVIVGIGFLLLVIPGLIFATRYAIAVPICVIEDKSGMAALDRSKELVKGHGWSVFCSIFATGILILLLGYLIGLATAGVLGSFLWAKAATFVSQVIGTFLGTISAMVYCTIYAGLRTRKEGLDLTSLVKVFE